MRSWVLVVLLSCAALCGCGGGSEEESDDGPGWESNPYSNQTTPMVPPVEYYHPPGTPPGYYAFQPQMPAPSNPVNQSSAVSRFCPNMMYMPRSRYMVAPYGAAPGC
jgi:hypothetical protein